MAATFYLSHMDSNVTLHLTPAESKDDNKDKSQFVTIERKVQASNLLISPQKYKKVIQVFESGSPMEFVQLGHAIKEVWTQNMVVYWTILIL